MRKLADSIAVVANVLFIITAIFCVVVLCAAAFSGTARAAEIPSAASGQYAAPDRVCRVELARYGADHVNVDILCITDAGLPTYSHTTAFAFGGRCIGSPGVAFVFPFAGPSPAAGFVAIDAADASGLHVRVAADATTLYNAGGQPQTWALIRPVASPSPYTCGAPAGGSVRDNCRLNPRAPWCGR